MERQQIETDLRSIFSDLLDTPETSINKNFGPDDCEAWDSISHLKLVVAIEQHFDIELSPEDQSEMLNFDLTIDIILQAIGNRSS